MSKYSTIRRYTLEIEKIDGGQIPSFQEIKTYLCDKGFDVSDRTIQRDFERIRDGFGVEISYDNIKNGYYIDYDTSIDIESFFRFLEIVNTAELLTESLGESKNALKYISFDSGGGLKGVENLKPLLSAIKEHKEVSFKHFSFQTNQTRAYTVRPYLLKEYQNRWYVIGMILNLDELRTFGIDRLSDLKIETSEFTPDENLSPMEMFEKTIGLIYSQEEPQKIVLSFTPTQGQYVKTLPLHKSQKIILDSENELRISIKITPNYELIHLILKHGDSVKVIEPKWLVDEIKENLKKALKQY